MKAETQYNDFYGTAAADISDHTTLEVFLKEKGVDTIRFEAIGVSFYSGYDTFFTASIICIDNNKSTEFDKHITSIDFKEDILNKEFFKLFKRFNVVITKKHHGYENLIIKEELHFERED
jgi:hypothetical protein